MVPCVTLVVLFVSALVGSATATITTRQATTTCDGGSLACGSLITYSEDNATEFLNPGRGWYYHTETLTSSYSPLDYEQLMALRNRDRYTLLYRIFVLDSFRSQPISNATLQKISDDLTVARSAYFKLVIRFSYTITLTSPRNDAPKSVILQHINQLLPVLTDHADVILAFQHGFIGTWGEGYYTDYFGDEGNITSQEQEDRKEVYDAIISTVPECIMVPVRTWPFKENLTGSSMPVSINNAYTCGNDSVARNARTGIHDNCFLGSETDCDTWTNSTVDRPLISSHSQYTIFGGETCNPDSERNACPVAVHDLAYFHFTYLNMLYHPEVIQRWKNESCYDTITEKLGYRLVLVSSQFPEQAVQGENMDFTITLRNDGFSAPVSAALLKIILLQGGTKHTLAVTGTNIDPRFWTGNGTEHIIMGRAGIPNEPRTWNVFLVIMDASPSLQEASQYNIITVNQPPTSATDGMNDLQRTINITTGNASCEAEETTIPSQEEGGLNVTLYWSETVIGQTEIIECPCGNISLTGGNRTYASRYCGGEGMWAEQQDSACNFTETARRLCQVTEMEDVDEAIEMLEKITEEEELIGVLEVDITATILEDLTEDVTQAQDRNLTENFLEVVDNILEVDVEEIQQSQQQSNSSARILDSVQTVTEAIPIPENETTVVIPLRSFAVVVQAVEPEEFQGQTFSALLGDDFLFGEERIDIADLIFEEHPNATASISIPPNVFTALNMSTSTRITHSVFLTDSLFTRRGESQQEVGGVIIAAAIVGNITVGTLKPPLMLTFVKNPGVEYNGTNTTCNFWDPSADDGYGNWSTRGCIPVNETEQNVVCECDHLTNFAILLDVSPDADSSAPSEVEKTLEAVSYIGAVISICCLILTIVTYLSSKTLRSSEPSQLLISLCFGYLGIYVMYIVSFYSTSVPGLCVAAGALVQYFMLATFLVMAAEAVNRFMKLVLVFASIQGYVLKVTIVAWTLPLLIVAGTMASDYDNFIGNNLHSNNFIGTNFCRPYGLQFYIGLLAPLILIYIFNGTLYVIIMVSLVRQRISMKGGSASNKVQLKQYFVSAITLSILLGLGWVFGLPATDGIENVAVRTSFQILFILLTAFQGLLIFIMHCLVGRKSIEARREWKRWFLLITCRKKESRYSTTSASPTSKTVPSNEKAVQNSKDTSLQMFPVKREIY